MSYVVACVLVGFWALGFRNGYSFGGLINILLVYAGLIVVARLMERSRFIRAREQSERVTESHMDPRDR